MADARCRLTPIGPGKRKYHTLYRCRCGAEKEVRSEYVRDGRTLSCGCLKKEGKHGHTTGGVQSPTFRSWRAMIKRCSNPNEDEFKHYGGRGIQICPQWLGADGFTTFVADLGLRPSRAYSLERVDVNGDYTPLNCRWATRFEQGQNTRRSVRFAFNGKNQTLGMWSRETGLRYGVLFKRIQMGWPIEKVLTTPLSLSHSRK